MIVRSRKPAAIDRDERRAKPAATIAISEMGGRWTYTVRDRPHGPILAEGLGDDADEAWERAKREASLVVGAWLFKEGKS